MEKKKEMGLEKMKNWKLKNDKWKNEKKMKSAIGLDDRYVATERKLRETGD